MVLDSKYGTSRLKSFIEKFTRKVFLNRITPNALTLIGMIIGILGAILFAIQAAVPLRSRFFSFQEDLFLLFQDLGWNSAWNTIREGNFHVSNPWGWGDALIIVGLLFMLISFALDVFDGTLARMTSPTKFGGIFDIFADRTVEICYILAIIAYSPERLSWPGLFSLSSIILCISIFLLIGGAMDEETLQKMPEKQKVIFYANGLMERTETFIFLFFMIIFPIFRSFLLWTFAGLVFFTAIQRFIQAYRMFNGKKDRNIHHLE